MAVFTTVVEYLRNLLDDGKPTAAYWHDDELNAYLARWRRSVTLPHFASESIHLIPTASGTRWTPAVPMPASGDPLASVLTPDPDYTTFRADDRYRFWADSPAPVVFVGGAKVTGASGWAYTLDELNGAITFTTVAGSAGAAVSAVYTVQASYAYFPVYEVAYEALIVALGQWAAVEELATPERKVRRARLEASLARVEKLRGLGQPLTVRTARKHR